MADDQTLVERNAAFATNFDYADLEIKPRLPTLSPSSITPVAVRLCSRCLRSPKRSPRLSRPTPR